MGRDGWRGWMEGDEKEKDVFELLFLLFKHLPLW